MPNPDRSGRIGPSDVAVLFGLSPYKSLYQLWHEKAGNIEPEDLSDKDVVKFGVNMERAVAHWFCQENGLIYCKGKFRSAEDIEGFGGENDYEIDFMDKQKGNGILEVKTTGWQSYKEWKDGEPPMHFQLQLQAYMGLAGLKWGMLAILVDRKLLPPFEYEFKPQAYEAIKKAVVNFWQSIKEGREPDPTDDDKMQPFIRKLLTDEVVDLSANNKLASLIEEYKRNDALILSSITPQYNSAMAKKAVIKGEIQKYLFDNKISSKKITVNGTQINTRFVKECTIKRKASQYIIINNEGVTENE